MKEFLVIEKKTVGKILIGKDKWYCHTCARDKEIKGIDLNIEEIEPDKVNHPLDTHEARVKRMIIKLECGHPFPSLSGKVSG